MKTKLNLTKVGGFKMEVFLEGGPPKIKFFNLLSWTHEIFKVTKCKRTIKFDQIWWYQNGRSPSNEAAKIQIFLTICVRQMKFLKLTIIVISFDEIWGTRIRGSPLNGAAKIQTLNPLTLDR